MNHPKYNHDRPYRDLIVKYQTENDMVNFTQENQFWTLGGPAHHEFKYLSQYLNFHSKSYHTVDRGDMSPIKSSAVVKYPNSEFDIIKFTTNKIRSVSYDSTETLLPDARFSNDQSGKILNLARIAQGCLKKVDSLFVHSNWMVRYANLGHPIKDINEIKDHYTKWVELFACRFNNFKAFDGQFEKMDSSMTWMVSMHFLVSR